MTLPEPGVVIDLDGLRDALSPFAEIAKDLARLPDEHTVSCDASWAITFGTDGVMWEQTVGDFRRAAEALALIERLRALEGGGGEGDTSARSQPIVGQSPHTEAGGSAAHTPGSDAWLVAALSQALDSWHTVDGALCVTIPRELAILLATRLSGMDTLAPPSEAIPLPSTQPEAEPSGGENT